MDNFKPQLLPNFGVGVKPDWNKLITNPKEWLMSEKLDGGRIEIKNGKALGRSLKPIKSKQIQELVKSLNIPDNLVVECEFYSYDMTFGEIMHFMNTEDVTSDKVKKKLQNEWVKTKRGRSYYIKTVKGKPKRQYWEFPGRDVEWLCTWHDSLKLNAFDQFNSQLPNQTKLERFKSLKDTVMLKTTPNFIYIKHYFLKSIEHAVNSYNHIVEDNNGEGLILMNINSRYKFNRITLKECMGFKMKNDNIKFQSTIIDVLEGTVVDPNVEKTVNELGRSVTSKKKGDRFPSGKAKGFLVNTNGVEHTASLKGFDDLSKQLLLKAKKSWIGKEIEIEGMEPTKINGAPRSAFYTLK